MTEPLRPDYLTAPDAQRLAVGHPLRDQILLRHGEAVVAGHPTYKDPASGLSVLTAAFLAGRGYCCKSGCRHCPFVGAVEGS
jgi:hypothetical protein